MPECVNPKGLWERGVDERETDEIPNCPVGTFRHSIQLRCVWWSWHMDDTVGSKVLCELGGEMFAYIFRGQAKYGMVARTLEHCGEHFETLKSI